MTEDEPVKIPIDGTLDLHAFAPRDVPSVIEEYLYACLLNGICEVRIIHGKGKGVLRRIVHSKLESHPDVLDFGIDTGPSGWGATTARLRQDRAPDIESLDRWK